MNRNERIIFIQNSTLGKKTIVVDQDRVSILTKSKSDAVEKVFLLSEIAPNAERRTARCYPLITIPIAIGIASMLVLKVGLTQNIISKPLVAIPCLFLVLLSLWQAAQGFIPLVVVRFRNKAGILIFDIVKNKNNSEEFEQFIENICSRIGHYDESK